MSGSSIEWRWWNGCLPEGDTLSFDCENDYYSVKTGRKKRQTNLIQIAVSNGTDTVVARNEGILDVLDALYGHFMTRGVLVAHNGWYADVPWIRRLVPEFPYNQGETMALGYLDDENQSLALGDLCMKYLPNIKDWKDGIKCDQNSDSFAEYNAEDAIRTMQLYQCLTDRVGGRTRLISRILLPGVQALAECSRRGIYLDKGAIRLADEYYSAKISALLNRLQDEFGISNPNQRQVVAGVLLDDGHKLKQTDKGKLSTSKGTLARLKGTPLVLALQEFYNLNKAYTAYVKRYKQISETDDGRSHSPYKIIRMDSDKSGDSSTGRGTVTGRTSSPDQQLPRDSILRSFFAAPVGFRLFSADYGQLQFRTAAWVAREGGVIKRYHEDPNFDPHRWLAAILYGKPEQSITKDERQIAKSANFGLMFMAQPSTLVEYVFKTTGRILHIDEAERIHALWHATMPGFARCYQAIWEELKEYGYVESFTGRRRHFGIVGRDWGRLPRWKRHAFLREAVNFVMGQGPEADITQIALAKCHQEGLPLNGFVHDSITFELRTLSESSETLIRYCMEEYPAIYLKEHFGVDFDMKLQVDIH